MSLNPFAPPAASLEHSPDPEVSPPFLWNPEAAARWSILLHPAFGAFLHMKNWTALGDPARAATARNWAIGSLVATVVVIAVAMLFPEATSFDRATNFIGIVLLVAWYYPTGRAQSLLVRERFGKAYPRKGWLLPIGLAILAVIGLGLFFAVFGILADLAGFGPPLE